MGLSEISIDFTKCMHKTVIIRGDNGSGKSTIMNALNLLPDDNSCFIPGMEAVKEIVLADQESMYRILCSHGIKNNGERETTKAYISIIQGGITRELNSNGNVTSFKEILYDELKLDSNFTALSQLSMDDKGLVDKKPAERKKFVNSIIDCLEVYNNIYKALSKKSNYFKAMISSISSKIGNLGDENTLKATYTSIQSRIDALNHDRDQCLTNIASYRSSMAMMDPDGQIQSSNTNLTNQLNEKLKEAKKQESIIEQCWNDGIPFDIKIDEAITNAKAMQQQCQVTIQIDKNTLAEKMANRESEAKELQEKTIKLQAMDDTNTFEELSDEIALSKARIEEIRSKLSSIGINNISSISKDEFITALNTAKSIKEMIDSLKSGANYDILSSTIESYIKGEERPDTKSIYKQLDDTTAEFSDVDINISSLENAISVLEGRSKMCNDPNCSFIKQALDICGDNPTNKLNTLYERSKYLDKLANKLHEDYDRSVEINEYYNAISSIVRTITTNSKLLLKMPNGETYSDPITFFNKFMSGDSFDEINRLYGYLDYSNLFEEYKVLNTTLASMEKDLEIIQSKNSMLDEILRDIDSINNKVNELSSDVDLLNKDISKMSLKSIELEQQISHLSVYKDALVQRYCIHTDMNVLQQKLFLIQSNMGRIEACSEKLSEESANLQAINRQIDPAMKEREKVSHNLSMIDDYKKELDELNKNYQYIETIKYYSSPTTGIQLVFMELYMGKIIALANELLGLLFNGEYTIQPFIINENEFRIPCMGSGYLNDDISSMSSAQKAMISMILSFALLHNSSTRYNIIKLDEIDAPLDENNRIMFIDVLGKIMNIMGTEQAIMISHNSEVQLDNSDVILLRTDSKYSSDYTRGNIIWKFD